MPLKLERVDDSFQKGRLRIYYLDEFGQPRFFEFSSGAWDGIDCKAFGEELIQQVNDLLARPRPSEGVVKRGGVTFNCNVRPSSVEDEIILRAAKASGNA